MDRVLFQLYRTSKCADLEGLITPASRTSSIGISDCNSVKKWMDHHLFLSIIPNNSTAGTWRTIWCDRGLRGVGGGVLKHGMH